MSAPVLTRWPIVVTLDVVRDEIGVDGRAGDATLIGWFNRGRSRYLERLPPELGSGLTVTASHITQRETLSFPCSVSVAVSVVELRQQAFDMQVRIREEGNGSIAASGGCTVTMTDRATGEPVDLSPDLREALIQLEQTAAFYC